MVPIVYGKVGQDMIDAEARGLVVLGGCDISRAHLETHQCRACGAKVGPVVTR